MDELLALPGPPELPEDRKLVIGLNWQTALDFPHWPMADRGFLSNDPYKILINLWNAWRAKSGIIILNRYVQRLVSTKICEANLYAELEEFEQFANTNIDAISALESHPDFHLAANLVVLLDSILSRTSGWKQLLEVTPIQRALALLTQHLRHLEVQNSLGIYAVMRVIVLEDLPISRLVSKYDWAKPVLLYSHYHYPTQESSEYRAKVLQALNSTKHAQWVFVERGVPISSSLSRHAQPANTA